MNPGLVAYYRVGVLVPYRYYRRKVRQTRHWRGRRFVVRA